MIFAKLVKEESGATAIEYGLLAAMISLACVVLFQAMGLNLAGIFQTIAATLAGALGRASI